MSSAPSKFPWHAMSQSLDIGSFLLNSVKQFLKTTLASLFTLSRGNFKHIMSSIPFTGRRKYRGKDKWNVLTPESQANSGNWKKRLPSKYWNLEILDSQMKMCLAWTLQKTKHLSTWWFACFPRNILRLSEMISFNCQLDTALTQESLNERLSILGWSLGLSVRDCLN